MNTTLKDQLLQFWKGTQDVLFPFLQEDEQLELTPKLMEVVTVLEFIEIEKFVPSSRGWVGRPAKQRIELARAFVAKAILNLPTTEALIDRLKMDKSLRRICGFDGPRTVPNKERFSRAFSEFAEMRLPEQVHEALLKRRLGCHVACHISHDATEIEAREKPHKKEEEKKTPPPAKSPALTSVTQLMETPDEKKKMAGNLIPTQESARSTATQLTEENSKNENEVAPQPPQQKKKRGRPKKGEERPQEPTRLKRQINQSLDEIKAELSCLCDVGTKRNSKGHKESWIGYKLHLSTADGDIPVVAILTSASTHDSQVMFPLMRISTARLTYFYDLADAAYCSDIIREQSRQLDHVPLIDHNPRRGEKKDFAPHEAERYKNRSSAERINSHLKDNHGGRYVRVKGHTKVFAHLMFGVLAIAAEQILRLIK